MNRVFLAAILAGTGFVALAAVNPSVAQTAPAASADADARADRVVTRDEELARADARFDRLDVNKDGKLTPDELRPQGRMGRRGEQPAADSNTPPPAGGPGAGGRGFGDRMFARLDTNGDGVVDRNEFRAQAMRRFDRMDTNHDGKIDAAERQAARDAMGQMRGRRGGDGDDTPPPPPPAQ